jgi:uroporphyrinogen decarboxylase
MITPRQRVLDALNHIETDRVPRDLGGMLSSSISAFAYPRLVDALGLPPRRPKVYDTYQMLALPDLDVLDALGCDVVTITGEVTNAFEQPEKWHPYDFNGRLPALVRDPERFQTQTDGVIVQRTGKLAKPSDRDRTAVIATIRMPPSSHVFDEEHGGQPVDFQGALPKPDLAEVRRELEANLLNDEDIAIIRDLCRRVRESTGRAVFFNDGRLVAPICIHGWGGMAVFPVLCITEPDFVHELHELATTYIVENIKRLMPEINEYVDIIWLASDDWGTQKSTIASPRVFRDLFLPYLQRINSACHKAAPDVKTFRHSCGAIYSLLDLITESGFDVLNPVQWTAGGRSYAEWKDKARGKLALWGGGVNSQGTLPLGTAEEVAAEAGEVVSVMRQDGGFVFCNIHNILAEIKPENVIAMYRAAS